MKTIMLGIESTAHTFGCAICVKEDDGNVSILSNVKDSFTTETGGMVPSKVADHHVNVCQDILKSALNAANVELSDLTAVSFSISPGNGHALRIGATLAKSIAMIYNIPLVGVNHCVAHLEIGSLETDSTDPVLLYASGANTQVISYEAGKYRVFGETLDTGVGNFLDTLARYMGLGFPGGPKIGMLAKSWEDKIKSGEVLKEESLIELPYSVKGMDVGFSGILTKLRTMISQEKYSHEQIAYSAQEYVFAMLLEVSERAMAHLGKKELLLGGGVACSPKLQAMSKAMCEQYGAKCFVPSNQYLVDNAGMIAYCGLIQYLAGDRVEIRNAKIKPYERTDDVEVVWRD